MNQPISDPIYAYVGAVRTKEQLVLKPLTCVFTCHREGLVHLHPPREITDGPVSEVLYELTSLDSKDWILSFLHFTAARLFVDRAIPDIASQYIYYCIHSGLSD